jgi:hypothetical protein
VQGVEATFVPIRPDHHWSSKETLLIESDDRGQLDTSTQVYHCPKRIQPSENALQINRSHPQGMFEMFLIATKLSVRLG